MHYIVLHQSVLTVSICQMSTGPVRDIIFPDYQYQTNRISRERTLC